MVTSARRLRLLHLTDPHLFADPGGSLRGTVTAESLARVLDHVARSAWRPQVVALTGDVAQDDSRAAYERLRGMLAPLGLPVHCVPGNHDLPEAMRDVLDRPPFLYCATSEHGRWLIAGLDSQVAGAVGGRVDARDLERLAKELAQTRAEHAVVCLHHPPLPVGSRWIDALRLENGEAFLESLAAIGKVRLVLFGHVHQTFDATFGPLRVIGTPSTCSQFLAGSAGYAESDEPPAYRRVVLHADGAVETELVWVAHAAA